AAKNAYSGDQLTVFLSWFIGCTGVLACLMQFFLTARMMERFGVFIALLLLPLGMGSGLLMFIPTVALWAAITAQASNYVFRYTINDATMQLLYIPVASAKRGRAKAFIDGMVKQWSIGLTGVVLYFMAKAGYSLASLAVVPVVLVFVWVFILWKVKHEYLASLMDTLRKRSLDMSSMGLNAGDEGTVKMISGLLSDRTARAEQLLHVLDIMSQMNRRDWSAQLVDLTAHEDPRVRNRSLELLGAYGWGTDLGKMMKCLQDPDEQVRATAIITFCQLLKERAVSQVRPFLRDPSPRIRCAAVSGLVKHCGLDGILEAAETLKKLLDNPDEHERFWGAATMRQIAISNFYRTLIKLIGDRSVEVQKEAIRAAGEMKSMELVPALVYKLGFKTTSSVAAEALSRYGEPVLDTLSKVLQNPMEKREVRQKIPRVMADIETRKAFDCLIKCINEADDTVRTRIISAMARIRRRHPEMGIDDSVITRRIIEEITSAYQGYVTIKELEFGDSGYSFLREAVELKTRRAIVSVLKLLECLYPHSQMNVIANNLQSGVPALRSNAIEAIDNLVSRSIGRLLLPLLEVGRNHLAQWHVENIPGIRSQGAAEWIQELLDSADAWTVACAVNEVRTRKMTELMPKVARHVRAGDPLVRETVLFAMLDRGWTDVDENELLRLKNDRSAEVVFFAGRLMELKTKGGGDDAVNA
ncbi:MAG: HEAT repeat domain-containing protein, partial [Myxococcota bacterium]